MNASNDDTNDNVNTTDPESKQDRKDDDADANDDDDINDGMSTIFTDENDTTEMDNVGGIGSPSGRSGFADDGGYMTAQGSTVVNFASCQDKFYGRHEELQKLVDMYINVIGKQEDEEDVENKKKEKLSRQEKSRQQHHQVKEQQKRRNKRSVVDTDSATTGANGGTSQIVLIGGDPGIGKTKLVQQFIWTIQGYVERSSSSNSTGDFNHDICSSSNDSTPPPMSTVGGDDGIGVGVDGDGGIASTKNVNVKPFFYLRGKYEELQRADPLSALVDAFTGFIHTLISGHNPEMRQQNLPQATGQRSHPQHRLLGGGGGGFVDKVERDRMKKTIRDAIGDDFENQRVLTDLLPDLRLLLREGKEETIMETKRFSSTSQSPAATEDSLNRFKYMFQVFVKAVCTKERPIILFLDDLQWADALSLELLQSMFDDKDLKHLLFVGAYRSNEVWPNNTDGGGRNGSISPYATLTGEHPFKVWMKTMEEQTTKNKKNVVEHIQLMNHSESTIREFISDMLSLPLKDVTGLSRFIYKKTNGNMFFVMQVLQELQRQNVITYSTTTSEWEWQEESRPHSRRSSFGGAGGGGGNSNSDLGGSDDVVTFGGVTISDNVVDTIVQKLQSLPFELQTVLSVAAFMRSSFDVDTLYSFLNQSGIVGSKIRTGTSNAGANAHGDYQTATTFFRDQKELMQLLDIAVVEGLLENNIGSMTYRFSHDKIQEAAYSIVRDDEQDSFRLKIGKYFVARALAGKGKDWMLFVAADHLNSISVRHDLDPIDVAKLNLNVGQKSIKVAAFLAASQYFVKGIEALKEIELPWQTQYDVTYAMYKASAEVQLVLGSYDLSVAHSQEILDNAKTLEEKFPAYLAMECSMSRQQRHAAALKLNLQVVEMLGVYPKMFQKLHLVKGLMTVKKLFRRYSDDEILQFRMMTGATDIAAMDFLTRLSLRSVLCDESDVFALTVLRQIILTFQKGLSAVGAYAVSLYGMILCGNFLELETGLRMAKLARKIQKRSKERHYEAKICTMNGYYIKSWGSPVPKVLELFRAGFKAGMETGDVEFACWNSIASNWTAYHAGYPLETVLKEGNTLLKHFAQYNVAAGARMTYVMTGHYRLLMGSKKLDWDAIKKVRQNVSDEDFPVLTYELLSKIFLAYYLHEFDIAEAILTTYEHKKKGSADLAYVNLSFLLFFKGLIACAQGRRTGKAKYQSIAKRSLKKMKQLVEKGALNDNHKAYILDAEYASCFGTRRMAKIEQDFSVAISVASNSGVLQDTALAYELAGEFFLRIHNENKAAIHFTAACNLYKQWGAQIKVQSLLEQRLTYIGKGSKSHSQDKSYATSLELVTETFSTWS